MIVDKISFEITTDPSKTDAILTAIIQQLVAAKTAGNIKYAEWSVTSVTEPEKGTI